MDKVNEFEYGIEDNTSTKPSPSDAIRFDIESNIHYRANSEEALLENDFKLLREMIQHHNDRQVPRLVMLDNYTKAKNDGIYKDGSRRTEDEKADYRVAHNLAKVVTVFDVGYNTGVAIKKQSSNDDVTNMISTFDKNNDIDELESELWLDISKYGRAYELQYRTHDDEDRVDLSNVFETFVIYDTTIRRNPIGAVRYPKFSFGGKDEINVILYTNTEIYEFKETTLAAIKLIAEEGFPKVHNYKGVPLTEYTSDRFRQGAYEDVIPLIDLYDFAQSDTANYMTDLNEAALLIKGDIDSGKYTPADLIKMKKAGILLLENGINPDGSKSEVDANYIYKQYDVTGSEAYKDRIQADFHKASFVPDLNDSSFSGQQTGEAMKYKILGFEQITSKRQRMFKKGLMARYRLLMNIKSSVKETVENDDLKNLVITFTPNLPKAIKEELAMLIDAGAEFSQETLLSLASFVESADGEKERIKKEIIGVEPEKKILYKFPEQVEEGESIAQEQ